MKFVVCIKHVADTNAEIKVGADGRSVDLTQVKMIVSPYDEYALEQAIRLRDGAGEGEIVLLCAGPREAQSSLRHGLAMGADRAVLIESGEVDRADAFVRADALARVVRDEAPDLVLCGKSGVGTDEGQTAAMLAEVLDYPHVGDVAAIEVAGREFRAERGIEGAIEHVEGELPVVLACDKAGAAPRYPSLKGIMSAKKKPLDVRSAADLRIDSVPAPRVTWEKVELPAPRAGCRLIEGDPAQAAGKLVTLLRDEAKVL